jgi:hypothetical protein
MRNASVPPDEGSTRSNRALPASLRVFLERGHAFDLHEDCELGHGRVRNRVAREDVGCAVQPLFDGAGPAFADARRIQTPAPGPAGDHRVAVTDQHSIRTQALSGRQRSIAWDVAGGRQTERFRPGHRDGLATTIPG